MDIRVRPPSMLRMSMAGPLGSGARGLGAPTINTRNVNGGPPGRW
jgi:hypothetical protein